jgi:hypothetical protein
MKIQTRDGEVELIPEMVRPGMVFRIDGKPWTAMRRDDYINSWMGADKTWTVAAYLSECRLLGCDPTIAAREDCERFGIVPDIDAEEHGFARLRGGGAVDLQKTVVNGAVAVAGADANWGIPVGRRFTLRKRPSPRWSRSWAGNMSKPRAGRARASSS